MRIGNGYDAHRFGAGDHIVIAGVRIEHSHALLAHSDGDVAIHALCDALLGAAGLGDIGQLFPDNDARYAGIDSRVLLREVIKRLQQQGLSVSNIDMTIVAQAPKMAPHIPAMRQYLAEDLGVDSSRVNIKATTTEGMGFTGRGEGIAAHAVVLIKED
jgi:2-C-methyl-D-erythritol 2,4-cyclodiphosphate synthase